MTKDYNYQDMINIDILLTKKSIFDLISKRLCISFGIFYYIVDLKKYYKF